MSISYQTEVICDFPDCKCQAKACGRGVVGAHEALEEMGWQIVPTIVEYYEGNAILGFKLPGRKTKAVVGQKHYCPVHHVEIDEEKAA